MRPFAFKAILVSLALVLPNYEKTLGSLRLSFRMRLMTGRRASRSTQPVGSNPKDTARALRSCQSEIKATGQRPLYDYKQHPKFMQPPHSGLCSFTALVIPKLRRRFKGHIHTGAAGKLETRPATPNLRRGSCILGAVRGQGSRRPARRIGQ